MAAEVQALSSEEDSDDELLHYDPFSQESTTSLTQELKGEKDDDGSDVDNESEIEAKASRKVQSASIPPIITSASQLYWRRRNKTINHKQLKMYAPCRRCEADEGIGLDLPRWDPATKALIQDIEYPYLGKMEVVPLTVLIPFNCSGNGNKEADGNGWSMHLSSLYAEQLQRKGYTKCDVRTEILYLDRILKNAIQIEQEKSKHGNQEETQDECTAFATGSCDEDNCEKIRTEKAEEVGADGSSDENELSEIDRDESEHKTEPIRPGDVVTYYSYVYVKGDQRGLRKAKVLSVDPRRDPILVIDNGDYLPKDTEVKRLQITFRNKLKDHDGVYRRIDSFKLRKSSLKNQGAEGDAAGILEQAKRLGEIVERHKQKFLDKAEAEGFAPKDLLHTYKGGRRKDKDGQKRDKETGSTKPSSAATQKEKKTPSKTAQQRSDERKSLPQTGKRRIPVTPSNHASSARKARIQNGSSRKAVTPKAHSPNARPKKTVNSAKLHSKGTPPRTPGARENKRKMASQEHDTPDDTITITPSEEALGSRRKRRIPLPT